MNILNREYNIIDTREKITIADSFVARSNKIGSRNGEAKLYIGNESQELREFFGKKGFEIECFMLKKDLIKYMIDIKDEYSFPEQNYADKSNMQKLWEERNSKIETLPDTIKFNLKEQTQIEPPRIYVKSESLAFKLIRELSLPNMTYISIIKLIDENSKTLFYLRLFVEYFGEVKNITVVENEEKRVNAQNIEPKEKLNIIKARVGQGKYRKALLEECPFCPITMVSDDRLLIASHIKPWVVSNEIEKIDPKNGFMLTPTYDYLFDRGFITFSDDKKLLVSPWLSKVTCNRLNLIHNKKYEILPIDGREKYLKYHRENIFKI